jgi:SAM-dependent methyltransferase
MRQPTTLANSAGSPAGVVYTGRDNLAAMRAATRYNRFLLDLVRGFAPASGLILDFGAGLGDFAAAIRSAGHTVTCLEIDPAFASQVRARGIPVAGAIEELAEASLDFVYSLNVLEHIEDDVGALAALRTRMKPGARALVYVPAFPILYSNMDREVGHCRRYTRRSLESALRASGFRVGASRYVDCLGFPASLAYRLLGGSGHIDHRSVGLYDRFVFPLSRRLDHLACQLFGKNVFAVASA